MSRRAWSRPRTKVYESNYDAGERYYKSALDGLDRKYGRSSVPPPEPLSNGNSATLRASLERERPARRTTFEDDEVEIPRRKPNAAALLDEFDSIFEKKSKNGIQKERNGTEGARAAVKAFEEEADQEFADSMKRVRASRAARAAAEDMDELDSSLVSRKKESRSKLNFSSKMIDSVGINEESSVGRKKILSIVNSPNDSDDVCQWKAVKPGRKNVFDDEESVSQVAAAARARKSRARLDDLEQEMQELEDRGAAREKRLRDLRALLSDNESNSKETIHSTVRVKSSIKTEKKQVAF